MNGRKSVNAKGLILLMAVFLLLGGAVGGTFAWLIAETKTVTNTFTVGDINIDLTETVSGTSQSAATTDVSNDTFKMIPGTDLEKDPKVTVQAGSEACWLFVKVNASNGVFSSDSLTEDQKGSAYITYSVENEWKKVEGAEGIYYREVSAAPTDQVFGILKDDKVHVPDSVTKEMMEQAKTNPPSLTFTAYAIQKEGLKSGGDSVTDAKTAWSLVNPEEP